MGQLVEVVFQDVSRAIGQELVEDVVRQSDGIRDVVVDGEAVDHLVWAQVPFPLEAEWVFVRLTSIDIGHGVRVSNAGLRAVQHGETCDVEFNADLDDVPDHTSFATALFEFSKRLAAAHRVDSYFAGLEPAADLETRLFTRDSQGPFRLGKSPFR